MSDTRAMQLDELPVVKDVILKVASRCNIACRYCYWFRDASVYDKAAVMPEAVEDAFVERLAEHFADFRPPRFSVILHGGEPLLLGKARFGRLASKLRRCESIASIPVRIAVTTNAMLVDDAWIELFLAHQISVGVSIDGGQSVHDENRIDFSGRGTFDRVIDAARRLIDAGVDVGVLAVAQPLSAPNAVISTFRDLLNLRKFDVLIPDATHNDGNVTRIADYFCQLFDEWYSAGGDLQIRSIESLVRGVVGLPSRLATIGYGAITAVTVLTDGSLEALDTLRIAGDAHTSSSLNIRKHSLQAAVTDPLWREVYDASLRLPAVCEACKYRNACGGGPIQTRWSASNRYANPSVYCDDLKSIFNHIENAIARDLYVGTKPNETSTSAV